MRQRGERGERETERGRETGNGQTKALTSQETVDCCKGAHPQIRPLSSPRISPVVPRHQLSLQSRPCKSPDSHAVTLQVERPSSSGENVLH